MKSIRTIVVITGLILIVLSITTITFANDASLYREWRFRTKDGVEAICRLDVKTTIEDKGFVQHSDSIGNVEASQSLVDSIIHYSVMLEGSKFTISELPAVRTQFLEGLKTTLEKKLAEIGVKPKTVNMYLFVMPDLSIEENQNQEEATSSQPAPVSPSPFQSATINIAMALILFGCITRLILAFIPDNKSSDAEKGPIKPK
jgi:hypothetical protein